MKERLGQRIVGRLAGFVEALENGEPITQKFSCRTLELDLKPEKYDPELVKATRTALGMSQALFAKFLGVSTTTVSTWERGTRVPEDIACRFMDEIRHNPDYWRTRLKSIAVQKGKRTRAATGR
jgi:putative transcriptional regulator